MTIRRQILARLALDKSLDVREGVGFDDKSPLCVYDLCDSLDIKVQFVDDISMEGVYVPFHRPTIILSSLRPLPRRVYNCAHELGHHVFGHGWTIDELKGESERTVFTPEEFLVDTFAGFLLMPVLGITRAFLARGWDPQIATPEQMFIVACSFGVGYTTIVTHLVALEMISRNKATALKRSNLPSIRTSFLGKKISQSLMVADEHYTMPTVDVEAGMLILVPSKAEADSDKLEHVSDVSRGRVFMAKKPGLVRVEVPQSSWAIIVRVSRHEYAGLSKYRHTEEVDDE